MALAEIRSGFTTLADGTVAPARASRVGGLATADAQGRYYEQTSRGNVFSLVLTAWTTSINVGNVISAAAGAATNFALWNPPGSGKNLSLLKFSCWIISGTMGVPCLFHSYSSTSPTIATSVVTPIACNNIGMAAASVARALTSAAGSALTGSSALAIIRASDLGVGAGVVVPANLFQPKLVEYIDGDIVIPPGTCWVPTFAAQGTTVLGGFSVTWEEIPS
jgi:hypothetical protein